MKIHNVRSPRQWQIISQHIDFQDKTVLDLGCGKGDIINRAFMAGATVGGIDRDAKNIRYIRETYPGIEIIQDDISRALPLYSVDIAICFSVLPYVKNLASILQWMKNHSEIALIECQYNGDGPGFHFLRGNDDMKNWLLEVGQFKKVSPIGFTTVKRRNKQRFIWMCN